MQKKYETVMKKYNEYFVPRKNVIYECPRNYSYLKCTLTLDEAIQCARQTEHMKTQMQDQTSQFKCLDEVKRYGNQKQPSSRKYYSNK